MIKKFWTSIGNVLNRPNLGGGFFSGTKIDSSLTANRAIKNPTVMSCLTVLSSAVGQTTFQVNRDQLSASDIALADRIDQTLQNPNPYQTHFTLLYGIVFDMLLYGNSYLIITRNGKRVVRLAPVNPQHVTIEVDKLGMPSYRVTGINKDGDRTFAAEEMLHFRDGGSHEVIAMSRLHSAGKRIRSLDYADDRIGSTFKYGLDIQYVLNLGEHVGSDSMEEYSKQLTEIFGPGGRNKGGVAIIETGELTKMEGLKPADADLRQLREDLIREIASVFAVPPFLVGGTGDTKYNNVTARIVAMYREALSPIITNLEQTLTKRLGLPISANRQALLLGDLPSQISAGVAATGGPIMTVNEVRAMLMELPELDDDNASSLRDGGAPVANSGSTNDDRRGEMPTDDGNIFSINEYRG